MQMHCLDNQLQCCLHHWRMIVLKKFRWQLSLVDEKVTMTYWSFINISYKFWHFIWRIEQWWIATANHNVFEGWKAPWQWEFSKGNTRTQQNFWGMEISWKDDHSKFHDFNFTKARKMFQMVIIKLTKLALSQLYFCETDICCEIWMPQIFSMFGSSWSLTVCCGKWHSLLCRYKVWDA